MTPSLELVVRHSDRVHALAPGQELTVGRTRDNDVQLDDPSVSRQHCTIVHRDGVLHIHDRESVNGTHINERTVTDGTAKPGDIIRLGAAVLDVRVQGDTHERRSDTVLVVDESAVESIIQRRIEPSSLEWLSSPDEGSGAPELALLKRAQRHMSTLH
ncbi:MAG: FHA domain-containing protein, partial [Vicinamibacterales bacterium]